MIETLNAYQDAVQRTKHPDDGVIGLATSGLGVAGEAGEVADLIKKQIGHGHAADAERIKKELGDVLWYAADIGTRYGWRLQEIAEANIVKLQQRYPDGFSSAASINRPVEAA